MFSYVLIILVLFIATDVIENENSGISAVLVHRVVAGLMFVYLSVYKYARGQASSALSNNGTEFYLFFESYYN